MTALTSPDVRVSGRAEQPSRCARGARCSGFELVYGQRVGGLCDRPLCGVCEQAAARVLVEAPGLYVQLRNATLVRVQAVRTEMVSASKSHPLPLSAGPLYLGEQLWWLLVVWEDEVRRIAGLSERVRHGRREGRQVADAARLLGAYLSAWMAAPATPFQVNTGRDPSCPALVEQSGVDAIVVLLEWRQQVRRLPGLDVRAPKAIRRYEQRCPACGVRAITHRAGDDLMQCQSCGATQEYLPTLPVEADFRETVAA